MDKREDEFAHEFDAEFQASWDAHRRTPQLFVPRPKWVDRVAIVSINGHRAIIKRMDEDGEIYTAEIPVSDLADFRDKTT